MIPYPGFRVDLCRQDLFDNVLELSGCYVNVDAGRSALAPHPLEAPPALQARALPPHRPCLHGFRSHGDSERRAKNFNVTK